MNARCLNTSEKRIKLYDWLRDTSTDMVFLHETHNVEINVWHAETALWSFIIICGLLLLYGGLSLLYGGLSLLYGGLSLLYGGLSSL